MLEENKRLFDEFKGIHDKYASNEETWQKEFNLKGEKVLEVIRIYEKELCSQSDMSQYSKYSSNLADKFWQEVRAYFPKIDFIGVE